MISVPDAGLLPSTPRPVRFMNGSITSSGKPCGYVGNAVGVTTPIISQWPVVVSLPFERSSSRPGDRGRAGLRRAALERHRRSRARAPRDWAGRGLRPRGRRCRGCSSLRPRTPPASGNSPAPTASSTITHARGIGGYSTAALDDVLGLLLLVVYIVGNRRPRRGRSRTSSSGSSRRERNPKKPATRTRSRVESRRRECGRSPLPRAKREAT